MSRGVGQVLLFPLAVFELLFVIKNLHQGADFGAFIAHNDLSWAGLGLSLLPSASADTGRMSGWLGGNCGCD